VLDEPSKDQLQTKGIARLPRGSFILGQPRHLLPITNILSQYRAYTLAIVFLPTNACLDAAANANPINNATPEKVAKPEKPPPCLFTMAPPIGLPISAPTADMAYRVPVRAPSLRMSDILATMAGMMENVQPDTKPYRILKTMMVALECEGSHTARTNMPHSAVLRIMTLKTPYLSPRYAGMIRPNVLLIADQ
jgi:hypothetical protein